MTAPRALLVANPTATRVTPRTRDLIAHAFASVTDLQVEWTEERGHASKLAADAARDGAKLVIALGGDGTVNECAQGLLGTATALAVVPSGGADVFARTLGAPRDTVEAADLVIERIERGLEPTPRGIGTITEPGGQERVFLFNAGIGFDAAIVEAVERHPARKRRYGQGYFVWQAVRVFFTGYPRHDAEVTVTHEQGTTRGRLVVWCVSDPYTFLGSRSLRLCPTADPNQGLSALLLEEMPTLRTLRVALRGFRAGVSDRMKGVTLLRGVREASISTEPVLPIHADGELLGELRLARVRWHKHGIRIV